MKKINCYRDLIYYGNFGCVGLTPFYAVIPFIISDGYYIKGELSSLYWILPKLDQKKYEISKFRLLGEVLDKLELDVD